MWFNLDFRFEKFISSPFWRFTSEVFFSSIKVYDFPFTTLSFFNLVEIQQSTTATMMTRKKYFLIFSAFKIKSREIIIQKIQLSCDFLTPAMLE